jgi:hypothetical protein
MFLVIRNFTGSWEGNFMNMQVNDAVQIKRRKQKYSQTSLLQTQWGKGKTAKF